MALNSYEKFGDKDLAEWEQVGSGGFGVVYRVRHKERGFVAIKMLDQKQSTPDELFKEVDILKKISSKFVVAVYGIYQGELFKSYQGQQGIVMEFMERGSIHTLLKDLSGSPPLPLAIRLAYQVALGMEDLHSRNLIHHDLKPSNVLLDNDFNAKLADFGLTRVTTSVLSNADTSKGGAPGTCQYIPPEAFGFYKPVRSFDVYSYSILLWSIFAGEEPFTRMDRSYVGFMVRKGDRPRVSLCQKKEKETGIMIELMERCWDAEPNNRPDFKEIVKYIEPVFSVYKGEIGAAIQEVLSKLKQNSKCSSQHPQTNAAVVVPLPNPENAVPYDIVDHPRFGGQPTSANGTANNLTEKDKATIVDEMRDHLIEETNHVMAIVEELRKRGMVQRETYSIIKKKETSHDKMRELFKMTLRAGGVTVKAAFYDALKEHEPNILESHGGS